MKIRSTKGIWGASTHYCMIQSASSQVNQHMIITSVSASHTPTTSWFTLGSDSIWAWSMERRKWANGGVSSAFHEPRDPWSSKWKPGRETGDWKEIEKLPPRCLYHFQLPQRIEVARFFIWNTRSCWGGFLPSSIWSPSTHGFQSYSSLMEGHIRGQSLCDFWLAPLID